MAIKNRGRQPAVSVSTEIENPVPKMEVALDSNPETDARYQQLLDRIDQLSKQVNAKDAPTGVAKEKYIGPRTYSYNMWGDQVVVDFVSPIRKEKAKDLVYKTPSGYYVENQAVELYFSDGTTEIVDAVDYGYNKTLSEKVFPVTITPPKKTKSGKYTERHYVFRINGEDIEVADHCIN